MVCLASHLLLLSSFQGEGHHGARDDKLAEFINQYFRQCLNFTDGKVFYILKVKNRQREVTYEKEEVNDLYQIFEKQKYP